MAVNRFILWSLVFLFAASSALSATKPTCSECGMMVDQDSRYCARLTQGGFTLFFCDIGDLLVYLNKKKMRGAGAQVRDHQSGEWIDAAKAAYVQDPKRFRTPMGWGIAAFGNGKDAADAGTVLDFEALLKKVK